MRLVFDSLTGNVRRFALAVSREAGGVPVGSVRDAPPAPGEPFLLLTYTFGQGEVPASTAAFLRSHAGGLRGVVSSGSYHWGENFGRAGDRIASEFRVPLVARLNKGGTVSDREQVTRWVRSHLLAGGKGETYGTLD
ncbi:protein NrdI [Deinococcus seoulensis]|uniref:Protein NrdI n=1 Tax=Deinococcus seoulensis TaxID=1837379 RepID=A0ABQ2RU35_9DEIO|nr:class Ib ribonucleoside-diphosphate reductase assembly flavoprotein NrdI [Deinococcus seoulensis]GGR65424.1 protein NrdI [Deinococcus seoulensis]